MRIIFLFIFVLSTILLGGQELNNSTLPILIIETDGQPILDDPKINVHLGIIDNGPNQINNITDPFNGYDGIIGIELRGQSSQMFPKKPFGFETRDINGDNNNVELLGMPAENDWVLHNPYSDKSLLRNVLAYKIADELMDYAPRTRLCEVVINDQYLGVYVLTEKIKVDAGRVDIAKLRPEDIQGDELTGGYIVKVDKPFKDNSLGWESDQQTFFYPHYPKYEDLNTAQRGYIKNWLNDFENVLASNNFTNPTSGYRNFIDVPSFVDFFLVNEISRNIDGYRLSTYFYKDKDSNGGLLKMGPVWDFNLGFGNAEYCDGFKTDGWSYRFNQVCPQDGYQVPFWWDQLMSDYQFRLDIKNRWTSLRTDFLSDQNMLTCIDNLVNDMDAATDRNFQRWPVLNSYVWPNSFIGGFYNNEVTFLKDWLLERMEWMDVAIENFDAIIGTDSAANIIPNPFSTSLNIDYQATANQEMTFQLFNATGALVLESSQVAINNGYNRLTLSPILPVGIYFYRIYLKGEELATGKLMSN